MNDELVEGLERKAAAIRLELARSEDVFDLMAEACSACCKISNSGNGSCPPPPKKIEELVE